MGMAMTVTSMTAWVRSGARPLELRQVPIPGRNPDEVLIQVTAFSLNRGEIDGEVRDQPYVPGWDVAGRVVQEASNGTGPPEGTRIVGMLMNEGAWAQFAAVPVDSLARIPDDLSVEVAVTLPTAGLTALHALALGGDLLAHRILITGASGGVGHFACQLAKHAGGHVVATARSPHQIDRLQQLGADEIAASLGEVVRHGPYDLILESLGGEALSTSLGVMAPGGTCVVLGKTAGATVSLDVEALYLASATISGLNLFRRLTMQECAAIGLHRLLVLVQQRALTPEIAQVRSWTDTPEAIALLRDRKFIGKAVLMID